MALFLFVSFITVPLFSQSNFPDLIFRSISTKEGLTSNSVSSITQSDDGQIWIGTTNGLNSYDGNRITNYHQGDNNGITLNMNGIWTMTLDGFNNLWISDRVGITKISLNDYTTQYYSQFKNVLKIAKFKEGILFAADSGIFTIIDRTTTQLNIPFESYQINNDTVGQWYYANSDQNENIYLSSVIRVHEISAELNQESYYQIPDKQEITNLFFDKENNGWVSTWFSGLYVLDTKADSLRQFLKPEHLYAITGAITEWNSGENKYIVGRYSSTSNNGLIIINKSTLDYKIYDLSTNVECIFVDRAGNLWIGTENKGILISSHLQSKIEAIPIISKNIPPKASYSQIYIIRETKDNYWLTKRYHYGIFKYDKNWKLIKEFGSFNLEDIYTHNKIEDAYDFKLVGNTMYATSDLGMFMIDNKTHKWKHILTDDRAEVTLRNIVPINDSTWLIRSDLKGIYIFNPQKNVFVNNYSFGEIKSYLTINFLFKTSQNVVIASTSSGIYTFDYQSGKFTLKDHPVLNHLYIIGVAEDQNNILWLCTNKGILSYDFGKNEIISEFGKYPEMGAAYRVAIDSSNKVWFANSNGFWSWDQNQKRMLKLNFNSGLVSGFEGFYVHVGSDGWIYLGGTDHVYRLNPQSISSVHKLSNIIISKIKVNNENKIPGYDQCNYQLDLPAGLSTLEIEFAVPDFSMLQSHSYQFRFSDSDQWSDTQDGKIFIPNLSHGKYEILMKGISNFSGEETDIVNLNISIQPFWYQSWWFKVLLGLALLSLFYLFYRWRLASENEKNKLKAEYEHRMILLEMQNLRSQMNPHFIFNALNSINGFIVQNQTHLASEYLTKFSRLIRMILDHSKSDMITLTKELEALNLYVMMEKNRFDQSFDFQITIAEHIDPDQFKVPPLILQPYIENSIWHGLMHQNKIGFISLKITQVIDRLCFTIEDNGVGRQKASELKSKKNVKSNSYGMQITQNRIKDHHTNNSVEISDILDSQGNVQGTRVIIMLKIE